MSSLQQMSNNSNNSMSNNASSSSFDYLYQAISLIEAKTNQQQQPQLQQQNKNLNNSTTNFISENNKRIISKLIENFKKGILTKDKNK